MHRAERGKVFHIKPSLFWVVSRDSPARSAGRRRTDLAAGSEYLRSSVFICGFKIVPVHRTKGPMPQLEKITAGREEF
jgi:hypothetical protein